MAKKRAVSKEKAKKILRDGEIRGKPLTERQKGFFGAIAGGSKKKRGKSARRSRR